MVVEEPKKEPCGESQQCFAGCGPDSRSHRNEVVVHEPTGKPARLTEFADRYIGANLSQRRHSCSV